MTTDIALYSDLLGEIKQRIRHGQLTATQSVNTALIAMYWDIGQMLHERQQQKGWGARVIPQ